MCSIYGVEEMTLVDKSFNIIFGTKEKQLRCENSFYCVFIVMEMTMS